jgi:hypothetical protein
MKFTISTTIFAALATTGFPAAADAIPVTTAVDEAAYQEIMNNRSESHRFLHANEPAANTKLLKEELLPCRILASMLWVLIIAPYRSEINVDIRVNLAEKFDTKSNVDSYGFMVVKTIVIEQPRDNPSNQAPNIGGGSP